MVVIQEAIDKLNRIKRGNGKLVNNTGENEKCRRDRMEALKKQE